MIYSSSVTLGILFFVSIGSIDLFHCGYFLIFLVFCVVCQSLVPPLWTLTLFYLMMIISV